MENDKIGKMRGVYVEKLNGMSEEEIYTFLIRTLSMEESSKFIDDDTYYPMWNWNPTFRKLSSWEKFPGYRGNLHCPDASVRK